MTRWSHPDLRRVSGRSEDLAETQSGVFLESSAGDLGGVFAVSG